MKNIKNILIIENELLIIDSFKNALKKILDSNHEPKIKIAKDYEDALIKVNNSILLDAFDLIILNVDIPILNDKKPLFIEDFGMRLRGLLPNTKILAFASYCDNYRINNIIDAFHPEAFVIKSDIDFKGLMTSLNTIFEESSYYSKSITSNLRRRTIHKIILDSVDRRLLYYLSRGIKTKDLTNYIYMSYAGVQKRKRRLKQIFEVESGGDVTLLKNARQKGFI